MRQEMRQEAQHPYDDEIDANYDVQQTRNH
jgi:integrase-like protein